MLESNIRFVNVKGMKPIKPDTFPIKIFVAPESHVVVPLLIDPEGYQYEIS